MTVSVVPSKIFFFPFLPNSENASCLSHLPLSSKLMNSAALALAADTKCGMSGSWGTQITCQQGASVTCSARCPHLSVVCSQHSLSCPQSCSGTCLRHTGLRAARGLKEKSAENPTWQLAWKGVLIGLWCLSAFCKYICFGKGVVLGEIA